MYMYSQEYKWRSSMTWILRGIIALPVWLHAALAVGTVVWFGWSKGKLDASYAASGHPVNYMTGQTRFSGTQVKEYYAVMADAGTLDIYYATQLIDFAFILGFVGIGLFICSLIARACRPDSWGRKLGKFAGFAFIAGAICDAIENGWSFIMLAQPATFANWLALPYSGFAVLKFVLVSLGLCCILACLVLAGFGRILGKPKIG